MVALKVVVFAVLVIGATASDFGFGYEGIFGPNYWPDKYSQCAGKHQSPIDIDSHHVNRTILPNLKMEGFYFTEGTTILTNNGHTAKMTTDSKIIPTISGGPLVGEYKFSQLHFHWGNKDDHGSEDEINGRSYPMELHVVFYKAEYLNATAALQHSDGLCVLACLFEVSDVHNDNFNGFSKVLPQIVKAKTKAVFRVAPSLIDLLPVDTSHYFTYRGSLTTPPCLEVVIWIDFRDTIKLSHDQFVDFRALQNEEGRNMSNNFRAVQPLGDRIVLYNVDMYETFLDEDEELQRMEKDIDRLNGEFVKGARAAEEQ